MSPPTLFTDYADDPVTIGTRPPRFAWTVPLTGRGRKQTAYRILVATAAHRLAPGRADLWDTGKVVSPRSVALPYAGAALRSNMDCFWTVQIWDEADVPTGFAAPARFATGLLDASDWLARWIGMGAPDEPVPDPDAFQLDRVAPEVAAFEPDPRAPLLRKPFTLDRSVKRARIFVCGLGLFELRVNGRKVGEDVLATPRTDFRKRVFYSTYDVTGLLQPGDNVLGLMLGNGWFNGQKKYWGWQMQWHGSPRAIVQLEVEFADGSHGRVLSDDSWRGAWSPITFNCLFDGEHVDGRRLQSGWDAPGFDASGWKQVALVPAPGGRLEPVPHEQERVVETIRPVGAREPEPGVFVFDFGRNMTGWVRMRCGGGAAGETVTLRFGEAQHENGALNASSNNAACQEDRYVLRGDGDETFEPRFTFHGFQFVEVTGYPGRPDADDLTACFVRTAVARSGSFECGNDLINRIHRCTLQSQLCNVQMGVPTDDTQRPERQGWGADAWGTAREALYNLWMPRVYRKWTGDFQDQQDENGMVGMITPQAGANEDLVWSAAFILIPWWQYLQCGDRHLLEERYPALQRYVTFLRRIGVKNVSLAATDALLDMMLSIGSSKTRVVPDDERGHLQIAQWGDHLSTAEGFVTRSNLPLSIATAFYYQDVSVMADIATVLGRDEDAGEYRALADDIKRAFNERFFNPAVGYYDTGTQSAQAWPLAFGLVPAEERERVAAYFTRCIEHTQRRLTTGYAGTRYAVEALSMSGRDDLVWKLATSETYPSWGYMLRHNRTTSCERWDGEKGSLNHAPLGAAIDEWFYWGLAGIRPDPAAPGFGRIVVKPYLPADLPWAKASLRTVRGTIVSEWQQDGESATLSVTVPANCTARVHVPADDAEAVSESGAPAATSPGVTRQRAEKGMAVFEVGAGEYCFAFEMASG